MKIKNPSLPVSRLGEVLYYDHTSGLLHWKVSRGNQFTEVGMVAGHKHSSRGKLYYRVRVDGHLIMGHWIVWAMTHGEWPIDQIDHIDGDGLNNRLCNLRIAPQSENNKNAAIRKDNPTGVCGVVRDKNFHMNGVFIAHIKADGKFKYLGRFKTLEEAAAVRKAAEHQYGFHSNHGRTV